jgi:radical SAM superfamily enzyme YgiQ (UPF0313 family)
MVLLVIPPFTQINNPYPSTAFLKGYLNEMQIPVCQADLGIETITNVFCAKGLSHIFAEAEPHLSEFSENAKRIFALSQHYIDTVDIAIRFLQNPDTLTAYQICNTSVFPQASRFEHDLDTEWAFGTSGIMDKAKHSATLFIEDIGDFISETIDPNFGFSRYAESIGLAASHFDKIEEKLEQPKSLIVRTMLNLLQNHIEKNKPKLIGLSVPFPGNLISALHCAKFIRQNYPEIAIAMGGGYVSTELRQINEPALFDYIDFLSLDDGEIPLVSILNYLQNKDNQVLVRTFIKENGEIRFYSNNSIKEPGHNEKGTPDYSDLPLNKYISILEMTNPMHRLWNDGRWNKLMIAHGCYWHKCTFCDTSLDYICRYEPADVSHLADQIEKIIGQTGSKGFHFVDEAAPPAILKNLAIELIKRKTKITWWANIRFEKSFTKDLCQLLALSGCIGVTGGLEVASDRLLKLINKGVTVEQAAQTCHNFTQNGIMVHTYLMYGFPTETEQETIDSLEIVRQLFELGLVQSAFWHRFTMTCHSPVGLNPQVFGVKAVTGHKNPFANNEVPHTDPTGEKHDKFADGLRKALYNYMHQLGLDYPLDYWFAFPVPQTTHRKKHLKKVIGQDKIADPKPENMVIWTGTPPIFEELEIVQKKRVKKIFRVKVHTLIETLELETEETLVAWFEDIFGKLQIENNNFWLWKDFVLTFEGKTGLSKAQLLNSETWQFFRQNGLVIT